MWFILNILVITVYFGKISKGLLVRFVFWVMMKSLFYISQLNTEYLRRLLFTCIPNTLIIKAVNGYPFKKLDLKKLIALLIIITKPDSSVSWLKTTDNK